jgi:hypothetical protein
MDIKISTKISVLLEKINYLQLSIQQSGGYVSKVDKDLLINYTRELYDLALAIQVQQPNYQYPPQDYNPNYPPPNYPNPNYPPPPNPSYPPKEYYNGAPGNPLQQNSYIPPQLPAQQSSQEQDEFYQNKNDELNRRNEFGKVLNGPQANINSNFTFSNGKRTLSESIRIKTEQDKPSVNEQFKRDENDLGNKLQVTAIKDLKTFIGLNKRFSYINFLFNNDATLYDEAIDKINTSSNISAAKDYIFNTLRSRLKWEDKNEMVEEFLGLVERRFM